MDKLNSWNSTESAGSYLTEVMDLIKDHSPGFSSIYTNLKELKDRLDEGRFHLAILGQFKRGKSTFLNALLGENLLPGSALPTTAIPVFIYPGNSHRIHIKFNNDTPFEFTSDNASEINRILDKQISEENNPENISGVKSVELFTPSPILQHGLVLIDTPGIGSTHKHNTEVTMNFLKECDAAVFIFSPDPPITETELEFLKRVQPHVKKMIFVLNKSDYLPIEEITEIQAFIKNVLLKNEFIKQDEKIFTVSAKNGLIAAAEDNMELWIESGMEEFKTFTENFLSTEKDAVFFKAISGKALDMISEISMRLNIETRSLELPLDDLQNRMSTFRETINKALEQKLETGDILKGDRKRLLKTLDEQSDLLRKKAMTLLNEIIDNNLYSSEKLNENRVSAEFAESIPPFFEHELKDISRQFNQLVSDRMAVHENRAVLLIEEIKKAASEIFEIPYTGSTGNMGFIEARKPYWVKHRWKSSFVPIPDNLIDSIFPSAIRTERIKKRLKRQAEELSLSNVENLSWVTLQNLDDTFRKFTKEFDTKLQRIIDATEGALTEAMMRRKDHQSVTSEQILLLNHKIEKISIIIEGLKRLTI